jgi:signal transduction histidine kinase
VRHRTWPIPALGFGALVLLTILFALESSRQSRQIYTNLSSIQESYTQSEKLLDEIRSGIYVSSVFVRDFLLDPSHLRAASYRQRLRELRHSMADHLRELDRLTRGRQKATLVELHTELESYWKSMDPIFDWTPQQKIAMSTLFLQQQVLPRRDAVFEMTRQIDELNSANLRMRQERINSNARDFRRRTMQMMALAVVLGVLVAIGSIIRISRLENRAEEQHRRTERAEEELRDLSQKLVQAQEEERRAISRELHDEVGQTLTALRMELGNLETLRNGPEEPFREHLEDSKKLAEQTLRAVRSLAAGLRPSILDDLGLGPALEWQAREFSRRTGIPVEVVRDGLPEDLAENYRTCVYRIVQECLTNCARHAKAKRVRIAIHGSPKMLTLIVQDDGIGLRYRSGPGLGLVGIEERVRELSGHVEIHSQPGKGTLLKARIPLAKQAIA